MKRILVLGATGFLARHLIPALGRSGSWEAHGAAFSRGAPPWIDAARYHRVDVGSRAEVLDVVRTVGPDAIVQASGRARGEPAELCRTNVVGTANLLGAVLQHRPQCRLVLLGSAAEYGAVDESALPILETASCAPADAYGLTKLAATELALEAARSWGARATIVRPFNMLGAYMPAHLIGGALVERIHAAAAASAPVRVGRTDTSRDFIAVEDVVGALLTLLDLEERGEIYNLCSGRSTQIAELVQALIALSGTNLRCERDPSLVRANDVQTSYGSNEKARSRLGFAATVPLERSLRAAWNAKVQTAHA